MTMKCPFCNNEMVSGVMSGDGRRQILWQPNDEKLGFMDRLVGKGALDAKYKMAKFEINTEYCSSCKKMIFDTDISK